MDRQTLKEYLLVPGQERLQLIRWALSELDIVVKKRGNVFFFVSAEPTSVPFIYVLDVVLNCGLFVTF